MEKYPGMVVDLVPIRTRGDSWGDRKLSQFGGKGLFTKEIEEALLAEKVDLAVHSCKDLPSEIPAGLCLAAFPEREDSRDLFIPRQSGRFQDLSRGATVGTGSLRRRVQLLALRGDIQIRAIRGNVDTRIAKLQSEKLDGIVLAAAGLKRLGKDLSSVEYFSTGQLIPAVGQGALAIECRRGDSSTREKVVSLNHSSTEIAIGAERAALKKLGGDCNVPMALHAWTQGKTLKMVGMVGSFDGQRVVRESLEGSITDPEELGLRLSERMLEQGADKILKEFSNSP
jgi:hydroxymethylbilane synthase